MFIIYNYGLRGSARTRGNRYSACSAISTSQLGPILAALVGPGPFAAATRLLSLVRDQLWQSRVVRDQPWLPQVVPRTSYGCHGRSPGHGTNDGRGGPIMAAIAGPGGPFVAAMVGPGPSWIAITGPPGPTVGGTSLRVTGFLLINCTYFHPITQNLLLCQSMDWN